MIFYVGMHQPCDLPKVDFACVSISRLRGRKSMPPAPKIGAIGDSAGFTEVARNGGYRETPAQFIEVWRPFLGLPWLQAVASQDFMCEPFVLKRTGLTVADHQRLTIERFDALAALWPDDAAPALLPVLQGWTVAEYVAHVRQYADRLREGMWVGVGSVCKRQGSVWLVEDILGAILNERPDLRLHGFGVKLTALQSHFVRGALFSADSMAWSFAARYEGRDGNSVLEAIAFAERAQQPAVGPEQPNLFHPRVAA